VQRCDEEELRVSDEHRRLGSSRFTK